MNEELKRINIGIPLPARQFPKYLDVLIVTEVLRLTHLFPIFPLSPYKVSL